MRRLVRVDRLLSKRGDGATALAFFSRAVSLVVVRAR
jgi:hypothetical protein